MSQNQVEIYLKSIVKVWQKEISKAQEKVEIFTPFLDANGLDLILTNTKNIKVIIYTLFSIKNLALKTSSLKAIRRLLDLGYSVNHIDDLHANILIIDNNIITIGSQNLTYQGRNNKEVSAIFNNSKLPESYYREIQYWINGSTPITFEIVDYAENHLNQLESETTKYLDFINSIDIPTLDVEKIKRLDQEVKNIKSEIDLFLSGEHELLTESEARELIRRSAWWYQHSYGPCRAPGDAGRIYKLHDHWRITLGSNGLDISKALKRCLETIKNEINKVNLSNNRGLYDRMEHSLYYNVLFSVINHEGFEFEGTYSSVENKHIKFGAHSIKITDFINAVFDLAEIKDSLDEIIAL